MQIRVVIADDHLPVLASVGAAVAATGAKVVARARSPDELFDALREHDCDLLVCDYAMPIDEQVDGVEMFDAVRKRWPLLPVIVLTSMSNGVLLRALRELGVRALVDKTAPLQELAGTIGTVLHGDTVASPAFAEAIAACDAQLDDAALNDATLKNEIARMFERGRSRESIAALLRIPEPAVERHRRDAGAAGPPVRSGRLGP